MLERKVFILILIFGFFHFGKSQINDGNIRLKVLRENIIGKELTFGKWNEKDGTETHLTYLGKVKDYKGKTYKILNSVWNWGISKRSTSKILIFNNKNQYLGNYNVTVDLDLPTDLQNGILIFKNLNSDCDKNVATKVNLNNGLPKKFFRECKNGSGDIYQFDGTN